MKRKFLITVVILFVVFLGWRFVRPMQIFVVLDAFERPIDTSDAPSIFPTLSADECKSCHSDFYDEWATTIHHEAWIDPYFQVDWVFDGSLQICKNCHIPLDRQQEHKVIGFNDADKLDPILEPNPDFDSNLQHEGITCNVCHLREGKIIGVRGNTKAPHPVKKIKNGNQTCVNCHVVAGERWDTFFRIPPCGTVAEIQTTKGKTFVEDSSDMTTGEIASLGCVECHMPLVERPLVPGGISRTTRQHTWRGGHDPETVRQGLTVRFDESTNENSDKSHFTLTIANTGADHYLPTGTPDRHLTVHIRALDKQGKVLKEEFHKLKRTVMWRPFIVDLWDTRLPHGEQRQYTMDISKNTIKTTTVIDAEVRYHLLDEARRKRIGYENKEPINYPVFQKKIHLTTTVN